MPKNEVKERLSQRVYQWAKTLYQRETIQIVFTYLPYSSLIKKLVYEKASLAFNIIIIPGFKCTN